MATELWKTNNVEKMRKYRRDWYANNKEHAKKEIIRRQEEIREWFREMKITLKCSQCPENHPSTLDFHHIDSSKKEKNISRCWKDGWSKERILKEISKCKVLCSNCHRKEHSTF